MSADSYQAGFARGKDDALAHRPQAQPGRDLLSADDGYIQYWLHGYPAGYQAGQAERRARETAVA